MSAGIDFETTGPERAGRLQPWAARIVGFSVSRNPGEALYAPAVPTQALLDARADWVGHNAKYETTLALNEGLRPPLMDDTKIAAWLLGYSDTHLKSLATQMLLEEPVTYERVSQGRDMSEIPPEEVYEYGCADADNTLRLWHILSGQLDEWGLRELYEGVEKPLVPVLADMERRGVSIDLEAARRARDYFTKLENEAGAAAHACGLPESVSVSSTEQLARWLEESGAPSKEKTKAKGLPKTDANTLRRMVGWHPAIEHILDFREKSKLADFARTLIEFAGPEAVIHPQFNQAGHYEEIEDSAAGAPPGRLSCSAPNLQQLPHHGRGKDSAYAGLAAQIRRCIVARDGHLLVDADVSQQEPRVTALVAPEPAMRADFEAGVPIYKPMAELIYGREIDKDRDEPEWHTTKTFFLAMCLEESTPVLMADLTWKPIGQVRVGDKLLAFDESGRRGAGRRWRISEVTGVMNREAECIEVVSDGRSIVTTPDHRFLSGNTGHWTSIGDSRLETIRSVGAPWARVETHDSGWLGGMFDGEGSIGEYGSVGLSQNRSRRVRVDARRPVGVRKVVDISTTTGTFIANGFAVHNCYGSGPGKLAEIDPRLTEKQSVRAYNALMMRYRGLLPFTNRVRMEVGEKGYVRDYFGRIRWLPGVFAIDKRQQEAAVREAVNMHIQGPSATMIKIAMRRMWERGAQLLLTAHDSITFEVREGAVEAFVPSVLRMMDDIMPMPFPMVVKVGKNWGEMRKV